MSRMVVKRQWSDLSSFAHDQLDARNSEFADAPDFRVYKFAKGKWPEFALRTVVSAHQERTRYPQTWREQRQIGEREIDRGQVEAKTASQDAVEQSEELKRLPDGTKSESHNYSAGSTDPGQVDETEYRDEMPPYDRDPDPDPNSYNSLNPTPSQNRSGAPKGKEPEDNDPHDEHRPPKHNGPGGPRET